MIKKLFIFLALLTFSLKTHAEEPSPSTSLQVKEFFIDSDNSKLFCRTIGAGEPLIVLHGGPGLSQDYLLPHLNKLAQNRLVIFYDQRASGQSTGEINEATMTVPTMVKDLDNVRKAFGFKKVSLLGHSWGGLLAMHYAIAHPECVDKLILSNAAPASSEGFSLFVNEYLRRTAPLQEEINRIQSIAEFKNGDPELHEELTRLVLQTYCHVPEAADQLHLRKPASEALNGIKINQIFFDHTFMKPFDLYEDLKQLHIPTLIIHGDDDIVPLSTAQRLHESIPGSQYVVLKDCGHFPYVEQPEIYFQSLKDFN